MLAYAIHDAFAASLLVESPSYMPYIDGIAPVQGLVLAHGPGEPTGMLEEERATPLAGDVLTSPG